MNAGLNHERFNAEGGGFKTAWSPQALISAYSSLLLQDQGTAASLQTLPIEIWFILPGA